MGAAYKWENYQVTIMTNISPHFGLQLFWFSLNCDVFDDDECLLVTKWKHYKWLKWKGWTNIKLLLKTSSLSVEPLRSGFFLILLLFKPSSNHRFLQLKRKKGCSLSLTCFCSPPIPWSQLGQGVCSIGEDLLPIRLPSYLPRLLSTFLSSATTQWVRVFEGRK